jgi:hypothetical protein
LNRYILKEYGSWAVMTLSYLAGLFAGGRVTVGALAVFTALALYINSKQALVLWLRRRGEMPGRSFAVFALQFLSATLMLLIVLGQGVGAMLPYALVPCAYLLLLRALGEHALLTEIAGFALLALSALVAKMTTAGVADPALFAAVAVFFAAGVFKVRVRVKRNLQQRVVMIAYIVFALAVYRVMHTPLVVLLPLIDNLVYSLTLYRATLRMTGWIEVGKGLAFVVLMALNYH